MILNKKEKFLQLPDALLFDTDNTLYAYDPAHTEAMEAVQHKLYLKFNIESTEFYDSFKKVKHEVKRHTAGTAASHSRLLYFQRLLETMGLGSQILIALDLEQTYWRAFLNKSELFENVRELLDDIRLLGIPTAIVTDLTAQIQFRKIVYFGLDQCFDYVVTSEEAGFDKPDPAPFNLALEKLKPKGNCVWMIGDNPINDIQGAKESINAVTIQKLHTGIEKGIGASAPDATFNNFKELRKLLTKLVGMK